MDIVDRYRRINTHMFDDGIVNAGRSIVLKIYTDKLCESVAEDIVHQVRLEYLKFVSDKSWNP